MIVSRTPLRMSFVGGGSDIPVYYEKYGGAVLSTSIKKYMYVTVNKKFDSGIRLSYSRTENCTDLSEIRHPIVRNTLSFLKFKGGIEISSISDIPSQGTGLGSSSSYTVGLLNAISTYLGKTLSKGELGELSSHIEINLCGDNIGKQDQYAAAYGGMNLIEFNKDGSVSVNPIICNEKTLKDIESSIVVFFTGRTRSASNLLKQQNKNLNDSLYVDILSNIVDSTYEMKKIIESGQVSQIGPLLDHTWSLKKSLASGISDKQIDDWYDIGIKSGATGGKLLGAGNGGFLMFFAPKHKHDNIEKNLKYLKRVEFLFDHQGSQIVYNDT